MNFKINRLYLCVIFIFSNVYAADVSQLKLDKVLIAAAKVGKFKGVFKYPESRSPWFAVIDFYPEKPGVVDQLIPIDENHIDAYRELFKYSLAERKKIYEISHKK